MARNEHDWANGPRVTVAGERWVVPPGQNPDANRGFGMGYRMALERQRTNPRERTPDGKPTTVIVGSFRFKDEIDRARKYFEEKGIDVLAPNYGNVIGQIDRDFKILEGDEGQTSADLWAGFIDHVAHADAIYVFNKGGYIGESAASEMALARLASVPMVAKEPFSKKLPHYRREEGKRVPSLGVEDFARKLLQAPSDGLIIPGQDWNKPWSERNKMDVFGFTDHEGVRAMFVNAREPEFDRPNGRNLFTLNNK